jgi:hypothetical protein
MDNSITCPRCGLTSWHPDDVKHRYCGNCNMFHEDMKIAETLESMGAKIGTLPPAMAADHKSMTVALVKLNMDQKDKELVNICWLPEFFVVEMPDALRKAIVERLRHDAERLENGDLEQRMRMFI